MSKLLKIITVVLFWPFILIGFVMNLAGWALETGYELCESFTDWIEERFKR